MCYFYVMIQSTSTFLVSVITMSCLWKRLFCYLEYTSHNGIEFLLLQVAAPLTAVCKTYHISLIVNSNLALVFDFFCITVYNFYSLYIGAASKRFGIDGDREAVPLTLEVMYNRVR